MITYLIVLVICHAKSWCGTLCTSSNPTLGCAIVCATQEEQLLLTSPDLTCPDCPLCPAKEVLTSPDCPLCPAKEVLTSPDCPLCHAKEVLTSPDCPLCPAKEVLTSPDCPKDPCRECEMDLIICMGAVSDNGIWENTNLRSNPRDDTFRKHIQPESHIFCSSTDNYVCCSLCNIDIN